MLEFSEGYRPGVLGRIAEMHGRYYGNVWGPVPVFEARVAAGLGEFQLNYKEGRDLLLTVASAGQTIGSILIDGSEQERSGAKLRFYILDEAFMGRGIGRELLERACRFAEDRAYQSIYLWTVTGLAQSFALYRKFGFEVVEEHESDLYGFTQTHLRMERVF
ncbi:MAG: GNAT family N-acetyltransferase [Fimbriimonas sp.]